jgi:hypothetical protein
MPWFLFDLKCSKLEGEHWTRDDNEALAYELLNRQGRPRYSIENRLTVLFDRSITSHVDFFKINETVLINKILEMLDDPVPHWHRLRHIDLVTNEVYTPLCCVIVIPPGEYLNWHVVSEHSIGQGLREIQKAEFANKLIKRLSVLSDRIAAYPNVRAHGKDGYIRFTKEELKKIDFG